MKIEAAILISYSFIIPTLASFHQAQVIIRQCPCKTYETCLQQNKQEPTAECFAKCQAIYPDNQFVSCMQKYASDFSRLKQNSLGSGNELEGCTIRERNFVVKRDLKIFRDLFIQSIEKNVDGVDESRQFKNRKAANQAQCVFECAYPGRNACTKKLKCDIFLPSEEEYFSEILDQAVSQQLFSKSNGIYKCITNLFASDTAESNLMKSLTSNTTPIKRRQRT